MMKTFLLVALPLLVATTYTADGAAVSFDFVARHYFPAGYVGNKTTGVPDLFGFGFGSLERSYFDSKEKLFYGGSELGFVTISDFSAYPTVVKITDVGFPLSDSLTDIRVCDDLLFVTTKDDPNPGKLLVYKSAKRKADGTYTAPVLVHTIVVGFGPDNILVSKNCQVVATANEGEGDYNDATGLINPVGSVSIVRGPFNDTTKTPTNNLVSLNKWTEAELLSKGVHLPLPRNALIYWNAVGAANFTEAINKYTPDAGLEPEYLAFNEAETTIYASLQENNAVVVINVNTNTATDIFAYGLKTGFPVDIVEDDGCSNMPTVDGLFFLRSVDAIATFTVGGSTYLVTGNEGDDVAYGKYEERVRSRNIFKGAVIGYPNMTIDPAVATQARFFNSNCNTTKPETPFCARSMRFTLGSAMINYSNVAAPNIYRLVGIGGRGITIYKVTATALEIVWDSADELEKRGCAAFPWAHNALQDEEFAPVGGTFYNSLPVGDSLRKTIDELNNPAIDGCADQGNGTPGACPMGKTVDERSFKDGYAAETVVVGTACDTLYAVTVSEKNSVGFLYDLTNLTKPVLTKVFHLSPVSEKLSPGLAYTNRTLGEIDSESIQFLPKGKGPTGKAAVLFSGAFSGTTSLWEFTCAPTRAPTRAPTKAPVRAPVKAPVAVDPCATNNCKGFLGFPGQLMSRELFGTCVSSCTSAFFENALQAVGWFCGRCVE